LILVVRSVPTLGGLLAPLLIDVNLLRLACYKQTIAVITM